MQYTNLKSYTELLTPSERINLTKRGMISVCKAKGLDKSAAGIASAVVQMPSAAVNALMGLSLLFGVPLGVAGHKAGKFTTANRLQERELHERLKFYRNLSSNVGTAVRTPDKDEEDNQ